jgi:hypothetical protein
VVRLLTPAIAFGRLASGKNGKSSFELENVGGAPGIVSWQIGAPFQMAETSAVLEPGEKKTLPLEIETKNAGHYRAWVQFIAGTETFDLPVQAEVSGPPQTAGSPASTSSSSATAESEPAEAAPADSDGPEIIRPKPNPLSNVVSVVPPNWYRDPNPPKGVRVRDVTPTRAVIEWPASISKTTQFRVEMVQFALNNERKLDFRWLRPTDVPIEKHGDKYAAILDGLQPQQPYTIRIVPLDANGEAGERLFAVDVMTPPKKTFADHLPKISVFRGLLLLLAALLAWRGWDWWRNRDASPT